MSRSVLSKNGLTIAQGRNLVLKLQWNQLTLEQRINYAKSKGTTVQKLHYLYEDRARTARSRGGSQPGGKERAGTNSTATATAS